MYNEENARLRYKLQKCEDLLKELLEEKNDSDSENEIFMEENNDGHFDKKIYSDLGESFILLEEFKDLDELDRREQKLLKEQDNLKNYEKNKKYFNKFISAYGLGIIVTNIGRFLIGI